MKVDEALERSGPTATRRLRFGPYEADLASAELWRSGVRVRIQLQPFKVLALLASRPGELVTREEIQRELWPDGTFVDFEQSLNFSIRRIRSALRDHAATPRYVETLPRRGYRFIAPVQVLDGDTAPQPAEPAPSPLPRSARPGRLRPSPARLVAVLLVGALVGALGVSFATRTTLAPGQAGPPAFRRITFGRGFLDAARFGPQGHVIYSASWEGRPETVFDLQLPSLDARPLDGVGSRIVAITPNGEVAFLRPDGMLARVPLSGGPPKEILRGVLTADVLPDGTDFAVARTLHGRTRIEFPIGRVVCEAFRPDWLRVSRDGRSLAFLEHPIHADDRGSVVVVDPEGRKRTLSSGWASVSGLAWSRNGREIWFTGTRLGAESALHAVSLDGTLRTVFPALGRFVLHDIAPDGRVLLERSTLWLQMRYRAPGAEAERDVSWMDLSRVVEITPDGRQILFLESGEGAGRDYAAYLRSLDNDAPLRVGKGRPTGLSRDGQWVLTIPVWEPDHLSLLPTGAGEARRLSDPGIVEYEWAGLLPDGEGIVFTGRTAGRPTRVYRRDREGGAPHPLTPEGVGVWWNTLSPDGSVLVAACGERQCLYPVRGGAPRPVAGTTATTDVLGWADPGTLLVREGDTFPARVLRLDLTTGRAVPMLEIHPPDPSGVMRINGIAVATGTGAYAYSLSRKLSDLYLVEGLR